VSVFRFLFNFYSLKDFFIASCSQEGSILPILETCVLRKRFPHSFPGSRLGEYKGGLADWARSQERRGPTRAGPAPCPRGP
jgi:hypothetical protein